MTLSSPLEVLASALGHAVYLGLPDVTHETLDYAAIAAERKAALAERRPARPAPQHARKMATRRPRSNECVVAAMFAETWGSTALGFGGLGGAAFTDAYTVVIRGPGGDFAVYWGGRFAYLVPAGDWTDDFHLKFAQDLAAHRTLPQPEAVENYGAICEPADTTPEARKSRSQLLSEAGFTRRPSWRSLPSDE